MVTKAIIPVAGYGTKRLPITKVIEKCMLPIGNRPIVDYVVEDCIKAGIEDIYFVVGAHSYQLRTYYKENQYLNDYLVKSGKSDLLPLVSMLGDVRFHYITQPPKGKYGTAVPVALAAGEIEPGESVAVLMGDDFIYNPDLGAEGEVSRMMAAVEEGGCAMLGVTIAPDQVSRYGVLSINAQGGFERIVEKPTPETAPSNLINVSKYVFDYTMLQVIWEYVAGEETGEYLITNPLNQYVKAGGHIQVIEAKGQYLDGGTVDGWLEANNVLASHGWK